MENWGRFFAGLIPWGAVFTLGSFALLSGGDALAVPPMCISALTKIQPPLRESSSGLNPCEDSTPPIPPGAIDSIVRVVQPSNGTPQLRCKDLAEKWEDLPSQDKTPNCAQPIPDRERFEKGMEKDPGGALRDWLSSTALFKGSNLAVAPLSNLGKANQGIYVVTDHSKNKEYILKRVFQENGQCEEFNKIFQMNRLKLFHPECLSKTEEKELPQFARIIASGVDSKYCYGLFEKAGGTLGSQLLVRAIQEGHTSEFYEIGRKVAALNGKGIFHHDLIPSNYFYDEQKKQLTLIDYLYLNKKEPFSNIDDLEKVMTDNTFSEALEKLTDLYLSKLSAAPSEKKNSSFAAMLRTSSDLSQQEKEFDRVFKVILEFKKGYRSLTPKALIHSEPLQLFDAMCRGAQEEFERKLGFELSEDNKASVVKRFPSLNECLIEAKQ